MEGWRERRATEAGRAKAALPKVRARPLLERKKHGSAREKIIIIIEKGSDKPLEHGDGVEERKGYRMGTGEKMEEEERRGKGRVEVRLELGTRMWPA